MARSFQLELRPPTWGGRRPGAGRKASGRKVGVPHRPRPDHVPRHPAHVTLRACTDLPSLRGDHLFLTLRSCLTRSAPHGVRILHFSVQTNHVHLIVETDGRRALSRGIQGLVIRLAKGINRALGRRGRVWGSRYHARALRTPREVRNALVYVLQNWRHHGIGRAVPDPCSSAAWFDGWATNVAPAPGTLPVASPRTWLAAVGWRRLGLIRIEETPARNREYRLHANRRGKPQRPLTTAPGTSDS
jgi:REP-associated tyrosine transposase